MYLVLNAALRRGRAAPDRASAKRR